MRHIHPRTLLQLLGDWPNRPGPRYVSLAARIGELLADGQLAPGVRVPAERVLAQELGLSRGTVAQAYEELRRNGLLESRRGARSVTRLPAGSLPWVPSGMTREASRAPIDMMVGAAAAPPELAGALERAVQALGAYLPSTGYHQLGIPVLREAIANRYTELGVPTTPDRILVTAGAQQAIDLIARLLATPRETAVVESPAYWGTLIALRQASARAVSLDVSSAPWDIDEFAQLVEQTHPSLAFITPDFQNPTGWLMDDAAREQLVAVCRRAGVTLVADEVHADIRLDPGVSCPAPTAMHDTTDSVISVGSLGKCIWGGLRVGWIRAAPRTVSALAIIRTTAGLCGAPLDQIAATEIIAGLDEFVRERNRLLTRQRDVLLREVDAKLGWRIEAPSGGLSSWAELPGASASALADVAAREGVLLESGPRLSWEGALDRFVRLPFALPEPMLVEGIDRLARAWSLLDSNEIRPGITPATV
jgi:DNA-binding transcriptional MocR family regulator